MSTTTANTLGPLKELPADLTALLADRRIIQLALEAVGFVALRDPGFSRQSCDAFRPEMLLTLLTYCYATSTFGSDDVEWAVEHERATRYICRRSRPDAFAVRRFRRANRPRIEQCLVHVLTRALAERFGETWVTEDAFGWARRKVELAILMDTAASD
jgi:hypothetical protein